MVQKTQIGSYFQYIKSVFKNLSMGDKNDDAAIINTKDNKENTKINLCNHVRVDL